MAAATGRVAAEVVTSVVSNTSSNSNSNRISRSRSRNRRKGSRESSKASQCNSNIRIHMAAKNTARDLMTSKEVTSNNKLPAHMKGTSLIAHVAYDTHGLIVILASFEACKRILRHFQRWRNWFVGQEICLEFQASFSTSSCSSVLLTLRSGRGISNPASLA